MASRIDRLYNTSFVPTHERHQEKAAICYCPACLGLQCLERPRYFAGQLLTEAELNSEQAYVIAKNKLHNRYLHGWGIVCGLQVVCHDCDGWVTVKQGYAIDPCGNDIIVCDDSDFDVLKAIRECREGRRRRRRADCDPVRAPNDTSCQDVEEHWCVTIEYEEKEARPTTPLRNEKKAKCGCGCGSSCGCGCNGNGKSNGKSKAKSCGCGCGKGEQATPPSGTVGAQCEPTRIFEQYRLNVVEEPEHCATRQLKYGINTLSRNSQLGGYMTAFGIEKNQQSSVLQILNTMPDDSLLARIINCLTGLADFIQTRLTAEELTLLLNVVSMCRRGGNNPSTAGTQWDNETLYRLCCRLHRLVTDLYAENPLNVRCDSSCAPCPPMPAPPDPTTPGGSTVPGQPAGEGESVIATICCLVERLVQYAADCFCNAFLPPCPSSPEDDRLILACLTIKNGKIIDICNFSCRHYAGSFPSLYYWLSLVPIVPVIGKVLQHICCSPNLMQSMFDSYQSRDFDRRVITEISADENRTEVRSDNREVNRRRMGDAIRSFIMNSLSSENIAEVLRRTTATPAPQSDLDELREQVKALKVEMETLRQSKKGEG